ncbi:glycosyl transferase [Microbacterium sp. LjRoot45]|uniref:glycosyl transferase n=1 Tax=Microbacterium sp. LjRoot45 TaxID=3342329 RepID=UPI003ECC9916
MRFVWAVAAFVLATVMIGAGIAQRTVLQGPKSETQAIQIDESVPYVLVDGGVLSSHSGAQTLRVQGDGTIFAAYGRTDDMQAWLARSDYVHVTESGGRVTTTAVAPAPVDDADADAAEAPTTPVGSDLWVDEFQQEDVLITPLQLPADMSVLVASDGVAAAPAQMSITWPTGVTTPWAGPLIVGGGIMLAIGIVLYVLGVRHVRRSRGPRRKGLPLTPTEPIDLAEASSEKGVISASPTRRQLSGGRRAFVALPVALVSALLVTGCSADSWPQFAPSATPTPSATVVVPEGQDDPPAVTKAQAERILARIAEQVAAADEKNSAKAAAERLEGAALATRTTNYTLRKELKDLDPLPAIPTANLKILLPEAFEGWPRTFFAVVEDADSGVATIMTVTQRDAWSNYKLSYIANMVADASLNVAPEYIGAPKVQPDSAFLVLAPQDLAAAYADVLDNGADSEYAALFEEESDSFRALVADNRADRVAQFNKTGSKTGKIAFAASAGKADPVAMATLDSGAIVAVLVNESDSVTPTNDDAVIKVPDDNKVVKALSGVSQSATGFTTTYADQLFFFVPSQSSTERIQFLGYSSDILSAKVVKKK